MRNTGPTHFHHSPRYFHHLGEDAKNACTAQVVLGEYSDDSPIYDDEWSVLHRRQSSSKEAPKKSPYKGTFCWSYYWCILLTVVVKLNCDYYSHGVALYCSPALRLLYWHGALTDRGATNVCHCCWWYNQSWYNTTVVVVVGGGIMLLLKLL